MIRVATLITTTMGLLEGLDEARQGLHAPHLPQPDARRGPRRGAARRGKEACEVKTGSASRTGRAGGIVSPYSQDWLYSQARSRLAGRSTVCLYDTTVPSLQI